MLHIGVPSATDGQWASIGRAFDRSFDLLWVDRALKNARLPLVFRCADGIGSGYTRNTAPPFDLGGAIQVGLIQTRETST